MSVANFPRQNALSRSGAAVGLVAACAAVVTLAGCSKPAQTPSNKQSAAAPQQAKASAPTIKQKADPRDKIAGTYHKVRCLLGGEARSDDGVYTRAGFDDAAAFSIAFSEAATEDPDWGRKTIADSLAKPCKESP